MIYKSIPNCIVTGGPATITRPFIDTRDNSLYSRFKTLCSGCELPCNKVYSLCRGVVTFIGTSTYPSVTIQYNSQLSITYAHLKSVSVEVGRAVDKRQQVGVADSYVRVEALADGPSRIWPVRIGASQYFKQDPESYLDGTTQLPDVDAVAYSSAVYPVTFDYTLLKPYVITLTRSSPTPNWTRVRDLRVSGAVMEAGYLYNTNHVKQSKYINPKLPGWVESAKSAGYAIGYLFYARAQTAAEAASELYEFSYIVRQWPSTLGVWVVPTFTSSTVSNDKMLDIYRAGFDNLGLTGAMGLYVTRSQLSKCTWSKQQDYWKLWLIDHTSSVSEFDTLLTPDFFRLGG